MTVLPTATAASHPDRADGLTRRDALRQGIALSGGALFASLGHHGVWAAGSDAPEKKEVRIGFIPLTDCASVVMASVLGFDEKYGVKIIPTKEASWPGVRDKLVNGELDLAHVLYGLVYGVHMGTAGPKKDMAVLMTLNRNGQAITLSRRLADAGARNVNELAKLMASDRREYTFAQTFPTGTHAMWLYYWLASAGIHPLRDSKVITVPPPQMVANMRVGNMDGFCVGEPWNHRAILDGIGVTAATTQDVWKDHPEKVLGATAEFVQKNPNTCRAVMAAILEASRWIDAGLQNKLRMAETIAARAYVNTSVDAINQRILGRYQNGLGRTWDDPDHMKFYDGGAVNFPYLSDGMWFLTQHKRWGLIKEHPDYLKIAREINRIDLYRQAATATQTPLPPSEMRSSKLMDGVVWDGKEPARYADSFTVRA
ncbi:CmpA/NrtA family ABC transporter substrate-binding protein [Tepidicella xavieri]|uniref:Nitrate/nitrite transport system substrate-binding protein n=1 Tax=Tepidicella xavieri TaxID=360241 RepID=A0A4R6U7F4_9BURK|nr:CmpA/NrtA family ABC transporter substrate-binding protein [Tepidicella xavieri]TDQ42458.1 nitrate/nitrite transport system substrate-binding protein [Tepidicella xavieri]